ncbi:hypothetical protein HOY82DRAFT_537980 [Tuber indicum]|nr:hypothetical protein HOY82DRAFT_537980 [Tuber indicum]
MQPCSDRSAADKTVDSQDSEYKKGTESEETVEELIESGEDDLLGDYEAQRVESMLNKVIRDSTIRARKSTPGNKLTKYSYLVTMTKQVNQCWSDACCELCLTNFADATISYNDQIWAKYSSYRSQYLHSMKSVMQSIYKLRADNPTAYAERVKYLLEIDYFNCAPAGYEGMLENCTSYMDKYTRRFPEYDLGADYEGIGGENSESQGNSYEENSDI